MGVFAKPIQQTRDKKTSFFKNTPKMPPAFLTQSFIFLHAAAWSIGLACLPVASLAADGGLSPLTLTPEASRAEALTYATVVPGTVARMLPAMSRVQPDTTHTVTIQPAGSGKVMSILVLPGQSVQQGQPLLRYQNHALHIARLQQAQTRTALAAAKATEQEAAQSYARGHALAGQTVSVGEAQKRLAILQQAKESVAAREAELGMLTHRFEEEYTSPTETHAEADETSTIIAPFSGTVTQITTAVAADIEPTQNLLTVSDTQHVWVVSDVAPQDAALLAQGGRQTLTLPDAAASPLLCRMDTVNTVADPGTGLVRILSRVENSKNLLRPGMVLNSLLQTTQQQNGLVIPSESVQIIDGQTLVFTKQSDTKLQPVPVTLGLEDQNSVIVLSGLKAGTQVVQHGSLALKAMTVLPAMDAE